VKDLIIKQVDYTIDSEKIINIRKEVFIKEQNVPEDIEIDGLDEESIHFLAFLEKTPIGCARIRLIDNSAKLERIAILKEYRCKGYGSELTNFLIKYCKVKNYDKIWLNSQINVVDFYRKFGFKVRGEKFLEAKIEHLQMYLDR